MDIQQIAQIARALSIRPETKAQTDAPNYKAHSTPQVRCEYCRHYVRDTECELYGFAADADYVCDSYARPEILQAALSLKKKSYIEAVDLLFVVRHLQGKHNQKRHGWRFGTAQGTRQSMKDSSKGEREEYKRRARKRGIGGGVGLSDKRTRAAQSRVKKEKADLKKSEKEWLDKEKKWHQINNKYSRESDKAAVWGKKAQEAQDILDAHYQKMQSGDGWADPKQQEIYTKLADKRNKAYAKFTEHSTRANKMVEENRQWALDAGFPQNQWGGIETQYPAKQRAKIRQEFHKRTKGDREIIQNEMLKEAKATREKMKQIPGKLKKERASIDKEIDTIAKERKKLESDYNKTLIKKDDFWQTKPGMLDKQADITDRMIELDRRSNALSLQKKELTHSKHNPHNLLDVDNPAKPQHIKDYKKAPHDWQEKEWNRGKDEFGNLVGTETIDNMPVRTKVIPSNEEQRAYYLSNSVNMADTSSSSTMVHELGHFLEDNDPYIREKANEFLNRRTEGEAVKSLSELTGSQFYGDDEVGQADKFFSPYVGKRYKGRDSTEIISMGLEEMNRNPAGFAERDPDYFDFIYSLMRS